MTIFPHPLLTSSPLTPPDKKQATLSRFLSHSTSQNPQQLLLYPSLSTLLSALSNSMETNANFHSNAHPNERVDEPDLPNSASIAFVCAAAFLCLLLVLAYCHCHRSGETRTGACRLFRKRTPASPPPLPVVSYSKAAEELTRGCVVCLTEFEDKEAVKVIPGCGHVFHPQCIDRWLVSHVSCPVCRCSKIFGSGDHKEKEAGEEAAVGEQVLIRMERSRSWCYRVDDHGEEERTGMRRTCSF